MKKLIALGLAGVLAVSLSGCCCCLPMASGFMEGFMEGLDSGYNDDYYDDYYYYY